jgi:hypothetical protein
MPAANKTTTDTGNVNHPERKHTISTHLPGISTRILHSRAIFRCVHARDHKGLNLDANILLAEQGGGSRPHSGEHTLTDDN